MEYQATLIKQVKEVRAMLRKVPAHLRGGFHQMAKGYLKDAQMWIEKNNLEMASEKILDAKFQADRAIAMMAWA